MKTLRPSKRLTDGQQRKLFARYQAAHDCFRRGQFAAALERYKVLSERLRPHFVRIVAKNLGPTGASSDLSDEEVARVLAGSAKDTLARMQSGSSEARIASLCSAVAHDVALITRHLAEGHSRGRDETVAQAIIAGFAHAIAVNPANAVNYHNLAGYEDFLGRDADASEHYRAAVQLDAQQFESWISWGHVFARTGNREDAETCWGNALSVLDARDPLGHETNWASAMLRLLKGDYRRGWADYEARLTFPPYVEKHGRPDLPAPQWRGQRIDGTVLIHQEQGVGDALMLARYLPLAAARCTRVIVEVIDALVPLFRVMCPGVEVVSKSDETPAHDFQLAMFSLPHVFGTTVENIPKPVRFVVESAENGPIQAEPGRIGLCWRGSATHPNDIRRSMRFEDVFPLLDIVGPAWQSLQFGYETSPPLDPFVAGDFLETARQIARCSLVITVDTSVAHLAGVMGVPTWVLLPMNAEWRWLQDRDDSPWYPSVHLWRQEVAGDWPALIRRVADALSLEHFPSPIEQHG